MQNIRQAVRKITLVLFAGIFFIQFDSVLSQETNDPGILRIATSQFPVSRNIDSNAVWIKKHMLEAKQQNVDLIHFPECALSGYAGVDFKSLDSLDWQRLSTQTDSIMSLADELDLYVLLGSTHRLSMNHKPHNSLYVIDPNGRITDRYDKRFCTNEGC